MSEKPTVAIVGASWDRNKFGNKSLRAHLQSGYRVYPVNPKGGQIEGLPVYGSLREIPAAHLNRVSMYVDPQICRNLLPQIAALGCDELWLNPGSESDEVIEEARRLGMEPIVGCSILDLGITVDQVDSAENDSSENDSASTYMSVHEVSRT